MHHFDKSHTFAGMSLFIASLNSGSNGNCYYIGNWEEAVLIDAGISCRETERRMKRMELSIKKVKAIFVSHEHRDHIFGVPRLSKKYQIPVYSTRDTLSNARMHVKEHLRCFFQAYQPVKIGNLSVTAFPKFHDARDPHSFVISGNDINVGVFTDIGTPCEHVKNNFSQCHAAFLEANYDEDLLNKGPYSFELKERIRRGKGHLSNRQAAELFLRHRPPFMSHLVLSHLSEENNAPQIVQDLFDEIAGKTQVIIAGRHQETPVYYITASIKTGHRHKYTQLSLFQQI